MLKIVEGVCEGLLVVLELVVGEELDRCTDCFDLYLPLKTGGRKGERQDPDKKMYSGERPVLQGHL